jgi:hypothetical protein
MMGKHTTTLSRAALQSLGWTLITVMAEVIVYVAVLVEGLVEPEVMSGSLGFFIFSLINAVCCFFIVKHRPISIWFVPVIINAFVMMMAFFNTAYRIEPWWLPFVAGWVMCLMASIIGALMRKRASDAHIQLERR